MRKLFIEGLVIFVSILASLSVDNMRETNEEKEILNEAVITLGDEINSNINYTKETSSRLKICIFNAQVVDNYDEIKLKDVFKIHSENPYIHSIIENGKIEYKNNIQTKIIEFCLTMPGSLKMFFFSLCCLWEITRN